jgi:predicted phage-related endonuclease
MAESFDRAAFEEERLRGIGGSDWSDVLGLEPYGCSRRLWYEKRQEPQDFPVERPAYFERGHLMEQLVADGTEERIGVKLRKVGRLSVRELPEWWIGHPDRMVVGDSDHATGVFEAKTKGPWPFKALQSEGVPEREILQLQHYLQLTGWEWALYAALEPVSWQWYFAEVKWDMKAIDQMMIAGDRFWRMVENGPAPDRLMPEDKRCQKCAWRLTCQGAAFNPQFEKAEGAAEELDDNALRMMLEEYDRVDEVLNQAKELREKAREKIRLHLGDKPRKVKIDGRGLVMYETHQKRIDSAAIKRDLPDVYAKYQKIVKGKITLRVY